jgi:hypothetical protein
MAAGIVEEIAEFVGKDNVRTGAAAVAGYFADPVKDTGLVLVKPADEYELAEVADAANRARLPLFSVRREKMDNSLASRKGLLLDLSRMNAIKEVDRRNLMGHIFAGVTYEQLREECLKVGCKVLMPANATSRSVLRSYLDRDVLNGNAVYRFPNLSIFHAILSDGRIWVSGSQQMTAEGIADFREDQGPQFSLFFGASEDIFGIPFYGIVYIYPIRETRRVLLFGFDDLEPAAKLAYKINRDEHCFECVTANSRYLSVLLSRDAAAADALRDRLPAWTTAVSIEHRTELVDMWEKYVRADAEALGAKEVDGELTGMMDEKFLEPWYVFDRDYMRGRTSFIEHYDFYKRAPGLLAAVRDAAQSRGYAAEEVGQVVIPVYFGASCYCESDLYFDPADEAESAKAADICRAAYGKLLDEGSFIDRPSGEAAKMVYDRVNEGFIKVLKTFKGIVDPDGLMNPDQLLEGV